MNNTRLTNESYIFIPVNYQIKIAIACANAIVGLYGLLANSLILYFIYQKPKTTRRLLADRFIQSLALSDILCSVITIPVFTAEMFVDFIKTDMLCKLIRYNNLFFIIVTVMNYVVISIERYLVVFRPLLTSSGKMWKQLVVVAWIAGALIDLIPTPAYNLVRYDLGSGIYTHACKYDNSTKTTRGFFLSFAVIVYVFPSIFLMFTSIRILRSIRRSRGVAPAGMNPYAAMMNFHQNRLTKLFVLLTLAFMTPYISYIIYSTVAIILKLKLSFAVDYVVRYVCSLLALSNVAISPSILFYNSSYLRRKIKRWLKDLFCPWECL